MSEFFDVAGYIDHLVASGDLSTFDISYLKSHQKRFEETARLIKTVKGNRAIEIGATELFQLYLKHRLGFSDLWGTVFSTEIEHKMHMNVCSSGRFVCESTFVSVDIEREFFPTSSEYFDFVMFGEVIEHLDIDPMYALLEINRVLRTGGTLFLSTPNSCSARNLWKSLHGYRPHFFMQYEKSRSPYRHNFEHDVHSVRTLLVSAGFEISYLSTADVFEEPVPEAIEHLRRNGLPIDNRGDDIFVLAKKIGPVVDRWPSNIYV